jgi:hypothetical protein
MLDSSDWDDRDAEAAQLRLRLAAVDQELERLRVPADQVIHLVCCDPGRALCGVVLRGAYADDAEPTTCTECVVAEEAFTTCGARLCRLRTRLRVTRWWIRDHLRPALARDGDEWRTGE